MKRLEIIFVTPKHGWLMDKVGALVCAVTGSVWSHVAIGLFDGIFEAVMPELGVHPADKYKDAKAYEIIPVWVADDDLPKIEAKAKEFLKLDTKYGVKDCIAGGFTTLFGRAVGSWVARKLGCGWTMNCSETVTRLLMVSLHIGLHLRDLGIEEQDADLVTPQDLYSALKTISSQQAKRYEKVG